MFILCNSRLHCIFEECPLNEFIHRLFLQLLNGFFSCKHCGLWRQTTKSPRAASIIDDPATHQRFFLWTLSEQKRRIPYSWGYFSWSDVNWRATTTWPAARYNGGCQIITASAAAASTITAEFIQKIATANIPTDAGLYEKVDGHCNMRAQHFMRIFARKNQLRFGECLSICPQ